MPAFLSVRGALLGRPEAMLAARTFQSAQVRAWDQEGCCRVVGHFSKRHSAWRELVVKHQAGPLLPWVFLPCPGEWEGWCSSWSQSRLCRFLDSRLLTSLCLSLTIYKMGRITVRFLLGWHED